MRTTRLALVATAIAVPTLLLIACDVDDDEQAGPTRKPTTTRPDATVTTDGGGEAGPTTVPGLCAKIGGPGKVAEISNAVYANAMADCRIGVYFSRMPPTAQQHVKECMVKHMQEVFSCPGVVYVGSKSSQGDCRGLQNAHNDITSIEGKTGLNKADFKAYREATAAALATAQLSTTDIENVMNVINGLDGIVAPRQVTEFNSYCTCPNGTVPEAKGGGTCIPDGGYIIPVIDGGDGGNDTGVVDTGVVDAADGGG